MTLLSRFAAAGLVSLSLAAPANARINGGHEAAPAEKGTNFALLTEAQRRCVGANELEAARVALYNQPKGGMTLPGPTLQTQIMIGMNGAGYGNIQTQSIVSACITDPDYRISDLAARQTFHVPKATDATIAPIHDSSRQHDDAHGAMPEPGN